MPMTAIFICDECGVKKGLAGNINSAIKAMEKRGWLAGAKVICDECVKGSSPVGNSSQNVTEVFSDGSCVGSNPGHGGWAWATVSTSDSGYSEVYPTTNQRMEIKAASEALRSNSNPVHLYTDSRYVADCVNKKWYVGWKKKGWRTSSGDPVKNQDLWEELVALIETHPDLKVEWVKGHADNELNNRADELARAAAFEGKDRLNRK